MRCFSRRHLDLISIMDMFGESSMNSGASTTSLIRRASLVQSSSLSWPVRIACSGTRASADSSRMVISFRLISRLNKTDVIPDLTDAARQISRARAELWVGIIDRLARYRLSGASTWTHRTGTLGTGRTATITRWWVSRVGLRRPAAAVCIALARKYGTRHRCGESDGVGNRRRWAHVLPGILAADQPHR